MCVAFLILAFGLRLNEHNLKLNFIYPLCTLVLFAFAEFLLQSTLNSHVRGLLSESKKQEFLGTGILRSSRAFAHVVGFYLISYTVKPMASTKNEIRVNFYLYAIIASIFFLSYVGYRAIERKRLNPTL